MIDPYKETFYEARVSIPHLQLKIMQFVNEEVPILEEKVVRQVVREAFNARSHVLRCHIDKAVDEAIKERIKYMVRDLLDTPNYRTQLQKKVETAMTAAITEAYER